MGFTSGDNVLDKKETEIPFGVENGCNVGVSGVNGVEVESEFKPIGHPLEPSDEDHPVKCPVPDSSVLNDGEIKERFTETMRKRGELPLVDEQGMIVMSMDPPARAVRKRHHTLTCDNTISPLFHRPPLPPLPAPGTTIYQVLQQCNNEFEP